MDAFRKFFEEHAAFFGVVVPILAVVGSFAGSWAAGWVQARGGRDQAAAAREAAKIAAEAQRVAALWSVRQVLIAEYIHETRQATEVIRQLYVRNDEDGELDRQMVESALALNQKRVGLELTATLPVVEAVKEVQEAVSDVSIRARDHGPGLAAYTHLLELRRTGGSTRLQEAFDALAAYRTVATDLFSEDEARFQAAVEARMRLGRVTPALSGARIDALVSHYSRSPDRATTDYNEAHDRLVEKRGELIRAARAMLRSEDDVAPAVPQQRRRLWWRNSAETRASSA
ncbi:hypothetical protein ACH4A8_41120 [Streptomyces vietnamensis]|uniref:hypothetical protein n=1 Tax=Streptomyces vietnamensis TaxID=362257 RepID=UPI0037ACBBDB